MKKYRIRDWEKWFENNRSKSVENLRWVPIPNKHDGENFITIIRSKHGSEIYAAWVLMVQVASKCQPRGSLLRGNGQPHTPATLSLKTNAPEIWFKLAFDFLEEHTDWLDIQEVADGCQPTVSQVPSNGIEVPRKKEENEEKEYIEENDQECSSIASSIHQAYMARIGKWFGRRESTKWSDKEIKSLKSVVKLNTTEEDLSVLEAMYLSNYKYKRKDIVTLLNNWNGEIDRARELAQSNPLIKQDTTKEERLHNLFAMSIQ